MWCPCVGTGSQDILDVVTTPRIEDDRMLILKVNLKAHNSRVMLLHGKEIEAPMSLTASDVARIQVLLHLILAPAKLHGSPVMSLVHILVDVLDGLDRSNGLHIDVTAIPPNQIPGVTDHPSVVNLLCPLPSAHLMCPASVV